MDFAGINYIAVAVATAASFIFGAVWYMALAKPWMAAVGRTEEEIKASASPLPYIIAVVAQFVMAVMLAGIIGHLGDTAVTVGNSLISAFLVWLGFVLTTLAVNHGFQGSPRLLTAIDAGHWLGVLLVQGLVIGLFGV